MLGGTRGVWPVRRLIGLRNGSVGWRKRLRRGLRFLQTRPGDQFPSRESVLWCLDSLANRKHRRRETEKQKRYDSGHKLSATKWPCFDVLTAFAIAPSRKMYLPYRPSRAMIPSRIPCTTAQDELSRLTAYLGTSFGSQDRGNLHQTRVEGCSDSGISVEFLAMSGANA